ncbi:putative multidrug resistance protein fnx1 [Xylariaceae sp. FL0804]|nr:putative multidrug resistance protein fnx1 [Xylariaceae sp. FL0804]
MAREMPNTPDEASPATDNHDDIVYLHGPRFYAITAAVAIMMFLTNLEVPVVTTALVKITDDLGGFNLVAWVVSSYLLGYVAVIVIFAKFSDIFGRKLVFLLSTAVFIIFSAACSASQTMVQLIVFRALQGMGGGGCFSLCTIFVIELVPSDVYAKFVSNISIVNALALLLGPIIGGAIASNISWRWIFIINVPIALPVFVVGYLAIPTDFPYHGKPNHQPKSVKKLFSKEVLNRVDIPGTALILFATLALTAGFLEADNRFPWRSAYVITLLTVSGLLWIALTVWERYVTTSRGVREPVLPWTFLINRQMLGILLNFGFLGGPTIISMFILPQRFQVVYGTSGLEAGVRLIPFTLSIPFGSIFGNTIAAKLKIPAVYLLITGSVLQVIGFALLGTLPSSIHPPAKTYGFEILSGWGCGMNFSLLFIMIPHVNERLYHAVGMGAGAQVRMMGSAIVLAISTSVFNSYTRPILDRLLNTSNSVDLIQSAAFISSLDPALQTEIVASLLIMKKKQLTI